jgi:SAM-dependent methyltransferase
MSWHREEESRIAQHWDERVQAQGVVANWWQLKRCREHVNEMLTGSRERGFVELLRETVLPRPAGLAVSLGGGICTYEERLLAAGLVGRMECWELSPERCRIARSRLEPRYGERTRVINGDFLASQYGVASVDLVYVHDALHHIRELEGLIDRVSSMLKPEGLFIVDDFFGPTGMQWTDGQLGMCNALLAVLPEERKRLPGPSGVKREVRRRSLQALWAEDPSECARSSEMYGLLTGRLSLVLERSLGGAVFHPLLAGIAGNFEGSAEGERALEMVLQIDRILTETGALNSDYRFLVCRPRKGDGEHPV